MSLFRNEKEEKDYSENMMKCPFPVFFVLPSQERYIRKRLAQRNRIQLFDLIKNAEGPSDDTGK